MSALRSHDFPVPVAIENNRHAVLMSLVDAFPLVQVYFSDPSANVTFKANIYVCVRVYVHSSCRILIYIAAGHLPLAMLQSPLPSVELSHQQQWS